MIPITITAVGFSTTRNVLLAVLSSFLSSDRSGWKSQYQKTWFKERSLWYTNRRGLPTTALNTGWLGCCLPPINCCQPFCYTACVLNVKVFSTKTKPASAGTVYFKKIRSKVHRPRSVHSKVDTVLKMVSRYYYNFVLSTASRAGAAMVSIAHTNFSK